MRALWRLRHIRAARSTDGELAPAQGESATGEDGFTLIALVVAIFLLLLALSVAAPRVARALRRDREVETMRRANQYVRALQLYYKKFGHYPGSMEQLEKSNNIRFLRQKYVDPITGKEDWRLIHVGEQKTTVKGFLGKPLAGIASAGLGSASNLASPGGVGTPVGAGTSAGSASGSSFGAGSGSSFGSGNSSFGSSNSSFGSGSSSFGSSSTPAAGAANDPSATAAAGAADPTAAGVGSTAAGGTGAGLTAAGGTGVGSSLGSAASSQSGGGIGSGGAPFLGVGVPKDGESILTVNEQTTYPTWEFLYDPRVEQLRSRVNLLGGGASSTSAGSLGSAGTLGSGFSTGAAGSGANGSATGTGTSTGGSTNGSSTNGSSTTSPTSPSTTPQP